MEANKTQVGGAHYQTPIQHWDWSGLSDHDGFQYCITKYVDRWKRKGGVQDLEKAHHHLTKYLELINAGQLPSFPIDMKACRKEVRPGQRCGDPVPTPQGLAHVACPECHEERKREQAEKRKPIVADRVAPDFDDLIDAAVEQVVEEATEEARNDGAGDGCEKPEEDAPIGEGATLPGDDEGADATPEYVDQD